MMTEDADPAHDGMPTMTPSRAAFLSTGTADFHPPEWAALPIEANMHARLEAFRDSRHCATYMIATKLVSIFGRDQESCDHVLGNPSVSRKHAAIIHDAKGGIYLVDLMSRHGTFVKGKKIPPHDPYLLHEGDMVKFGQSVRLYILKGATAEGASAPVKKTWGRVRIKAPKISAVLPKIQARPKYTTAAVKLVNDVCYHNLTDEKLDAFVTGVMELVPDERKDVADLLVEKVHAKFEFYAAHVHKNAYTATVTLLKRNLLVEEFESNLSIITQLSQQRYDSIYRANARKILQFMAAVRLDPDNVHSPISNSYAVNDSVPSSEVNACPPTTNHIAGRDRVLSDEGKKLFLAGHGYPPPEGNGAPAYKPPGAEHDMPHHSRQGSYGSTQYDDDDDTASQASSYQPPVPWQNGSYSRPQPQYPANGATNGHIEQRDTHLPSTRSAFNFMSKQPAEAAPEEPTQTSAFGFIGNAEQDDDSASAGRPSATSFDFIAKSRTGSTGPTPPSVRAEEFLVEEVDYEQDLFEEMWETTTDSEEWAVELASEMDLHELQLTLERSRIKFISSDKISGMQQLHFCAEQQEKGTIFLVEIMVMPGNSEVTMTFKWIVNSLLYDNGHVFFIELFKYIVHPLCDAVPEDASHEAASSTSTSSYAPRPTMHQLTTQDTRSSAGGDRSSVGGDRSSVGADEAEEDQWEQIPVLDYLTENPVIEPAKFEQLWVGAGVIGSLSLKLENVPDKDDVIAAFHENRLGCLASGAVQNFVKFFFFGEMLELHSLCCAEVVIDMNSGEVTGTIKRFTFQARTPEEEEQINTSFVDFLEKIVQAL